MGFFGRVILKTLHSEMYVKSTMFILIHRFTTEMCTVFSHLVLNFILLLGLVDFCILVYFVHYNFTFSHCNLS